MKAIIYLMAFACFFLLALSVNYKPVTNAGLMGVMALAFFWLWVAEKFNNKSKP